MGLNVKLLLDTRRARSDGRYPLVMRVFVNSDSVQLSSGYALHESEWDSRNQKIKSSAKLTDNITRMNNFLHKKRAQAFDILTQLESNGVLESMPIGKVKEAILGDKPKGKMLITDFIDGLTKDMTKAGKIGNAIVYKTLSDKLLSFNNNKPLSFDEITYPFLQRIENNHYANGGNSGGLSVYLRTLRAIYNKAIKAGIASESRYPFKDYKIKNGNPNRKSLSEAEFRALQSAELVVGSPLERSRIYFMASFYLRGMNWLDMCLLRLSNIEGDCERIRYTRHKTGKTFNIKIHDKLKPVLINFINGRTDKDKFLFPILRTDIPPARFHDVIMNKRKRLNSYLKTIAKNIDIEPFTIYTARHTYATMGKRKGVPIAIIQESLGHTTEAITQNYLDSFGNDIVDKYDDLIMGE